MQPILCGRCGKYPAVVFITKLENGKSQDQGLCLMCAKEIGLKPVNDIMEKMGITEEDLASMAGEMMGELSEEQEHDPEDENEENVGKTTTFPFLNSLFGGAGASNQEKAGEDTKTDTSDKTKGKNGSAKKRKFLETYCIDLTNRAKNGEIDNIIGREKEIARTIQILNRRNKNNPCLIGEPGVGKTAIAEGLALKISQGDVPYKLLDKEVFMLDLTSLVAGTQFRGQFESRMKSLIDEIKKNGNIILVIDEVHNIVGAGDAEGSMNAANILKPALSRGEILVIGATTLKEYRKYIEKDAALERRFQPVMIDEPSIAESIEILKGIKKYYEDYHKVIIDDEVVKQAVLLSERYITDRFLPDKAIDLMDEACSEQNLKSKLLREIHEEEMKLLSIDSQLEELSAQTNGNFEKIAKLKSDRCKVEEDLKRLKSSEYSRLTTEDLAHVIEVWTNIPASRVCESEFGRLNNFENRLRERIIGQDEAILSVSNAIKRNRVGISAKRKPVSFIFAGPTGVGKTELVKVLAADLFDSPEALIRFDMSEFMEKHSVSRIIGSPPGYVGYDEAGQLTEKVRRKPYSVILFDEIEKAHPDVLNILLQILDDGEITDAQGRRINFENCVIVMTSNAGSDRRDAPTGFNKTINEISKEKTLKALSDFLRPEFINRVDEIIVFNSLDEDCFKKIASIMLSDLKTSLSEKGIELKISENVGDFLSKKSFSLKYGARNLRRSIQKDIEDRIAAIIISNFDRSIRGIEISAGENDLEFLVK